MRVSHHTRPATRLLALLELLQNHRQIPGQDLAQRLGVERRTIRRYIAQLEDLGIPITTSRGPAGGYALVAGYKLPPLLFNHDEALALALGLAAVRQLAPGQVPQGSAAAQAKLERVMPPPVKRRLQAIVESVSLPRAPFKPAGASFLPLLGDCAHGQRGVHLSYRDPAGQETARDFDPYALALCRGHWYVSGFCHLRKSLRTFRLDRLNGVVEQPRSFQRPAGFDVQAHLARSIATLPRTHTIEVRLETGIEMARAELAPELGVLEAENRSSVLLRSQADDLDWYARELARFPWPFEILTPARLKAALRRHARKLLAS